MAANGFPIRYALFAPPGLFDIVNKECGHAHASAGTIRRVLTRGEAMSIAFPLVEGRRADARSAEAKWGNVYAQRKSNILRLDCQS